MMRFGNKNDDTKLLMQALSTRRQPVSGGTINIPRIQSNNSNDNVVGGVGNLLSGGTKLLNGLSDSGLFNRTSNGLGAVGNAANDFISDKPDYGIFGNAANESIMGTAGSGSAVGDAVATETLGSVAPYGGLIMGGLRAGMNGLGGGDWKDDVPQSFFGIDPEGSDVSQAISGATQGAIMGLPFGGPIGATVGGLLGLGASFLDDI